MTPYQNCLAHSLQIWSKYRYYNLLYDSNHVIAVKAEYIEGYDDITQVFTYEYWSETFDIDDDEKELLRQYFLSK